MSAQEVILRTFNLLESMYIPIVAVIVATCICFPILLYVAKSTWLDRVGFRIVGVFAQMSWGDCIRLAGSWTKLIFAVVFLVCFQKLELIHFVAYATAGMLYGVNLRKLHYIFPRIFFLAVQCVAQGSVNLICSYMLDVRISAPYMAIYILLALFVLVFAIYSFVTEVNEISLGRKGNMKRVEFRE